MSDLFKIDGYFNGIKLRKGVWYCPKNNTIIPITKTEVRDFINNKTYKISKDLAVNCYLPGYERIIKGVRLINYRYLVRIGSF
jgi:hypothetical protein